MKTINKVKKSMVLLAAIVLLKMVKVKRTVFTLMKVADDIRAYIEDCVAAGSGAPLYANPAITTAFYTAGTTAAGNITAAIKTYTSAPTDANLGIIATRRTEGIEWLEQYATDVETIANLDVNRATREAAYINILQSYLTPQKLSSSSKGIPETPVITGTISGANVMSLVVTNGATYIPSQTNFVVVQLPEFTTEETPDPVVTLVDGQITITGAVGATIFKSVSGKGKSTTTKFPLTGVRYAVYAYAQNGKKLVSGLSVKIIVEA
jgi:hypothetical protein